MKNTLLISMFLLLVPSLILQGHGLHIDIRMQSAVVIVTFGYSESQPLVDGVVTIFSPSDGVKAYQTGRSDRSGNFAFLPDTEGEWTISVDDQKGHAEKEIITIPAGFLTPDSAQHVVAAPAYDHDHKVENMPLTFKLIIGLSLIFGITGFFYGYQSKRSEKK